MNTGTGNISEMQTEIRKLIKKLGITQREFARIYAEYYSEVSDINLSNDELEAATERSYQKLKKQLTRKDIKSTDQLQNYIELLKEQKGFKNMSMITPVNLTAGFFNPNLEQLLNNNSRELSKLINEKEIKG